MEYNLAKEYLDKIGKSGSVYGLETMRELLARLGNPQQMLKFIHVAGTNGKGSVAAYLSVVLETAGCRTGRYTSPAVFSETERFCVNQREISKAQLGELIETIKAAADTMLADGLSQPTLFEIETALAFLFFEKEKCDIAVIECGLGGALDATNVIENVECAVITSVSHDHMGLLGSSLEDIARQKAGIIREQLPVVSAVQKKPVEMVLQAACKSRHTVLNTAGQASLLHTEQIKETQELVQVFNYKQYQRLRISLLGKHQLQNAAVALEVIEVLKKRGCQIPEKAVREGLYKTRWPGRFTRLHSHYKIFMDGAHNPAAAAEMVQTLKLFFPGVKWIFIFGVFADKEYAKIAAITAGHASWIYTIQSDNPRALPADKLAQAVAGYNQNVIPVNTLANAVKAAVQKLDDDTGILAFGSLSFLKDFKETVESYMIRIDKIIANQIFLECMEKLADLEKNREFCRHDWSHAMDVARIAYIINLEHKMGFSKEIIYASALLHDLGRVRQYEEGIPHEQTGVKLAEQILSESGFEQEEIRIITLAISGHSNKQNIIENSLPDILFQADKKSRLCFSCQAAGQCNWLETKKNVTIIY